MIPGILAPPSLAAAGYQRAQADAVGELGLYSSTITGLNGPSSVAIDEEGNIWIADTENHRVVSFDRQGRQRAAFGAMGGNPGEFNRPQGIAIDDAGRVIVSDTGNDRIQVFDRQGAFDRSWGGRGADSSKFAEPMGVATHHGKIYVADAGNHRVQVFEADGRFRLSMGEYGIEPGKFNRPLGLMVDEEGVVWVVDSRNNRMQRFDETGRHLGVTGTFGPYAGLLASPHAVDSHERRVYVADTANDRIQVFESSGDVAYQWGLRAIEPREGAGRLHHPVAVAVAPSGEFAVVCEYNEDRCQVFSRYPAGSKADTYDEAIIEVDPLSHFGTSCHYGPGLLVITEPDQHSVLVFSTALKSPALICRFGGYGRRFGQFIDPAGVYYHAKQGRIYINDLGNRRLQVFQVDLNSLSSVKYDPLLVRFVKGLDYASLRAGGMGRRLGWTPEPRALVVTDEGVVYTVDPLNAKVLMFNNALELVDSWGESGDGPGEFRDPAAVAISADESRVYVADAGNARIQLFDRDGAYVGVLAFPEGAPDRLRRPVGLAVSRAGEAFVSDAVVHKVFRFDEQGSLTGSWGGMGLGPGQFFRPAEISIIDDSSLVVLDFGNHRAQMMNRQGTMLDVFGAQRYVKAARPSAPR